MRVIENNRDIAVVIPSYGRPDRLSSCLAALARQEGGPYRTYVVDDGSPEPLEPVCAGHPWVRYIRQKNAGPATARNAGAAAARAAGAGFLCFTDDDCRPHPGWARALVSAQGGEVRHLVGGRVLNALAENVYSSASQSLADYLSEYFREAGGILPFFTSNNIGCSTDLFEELGGFDQSFPLAAAEDRDFCVRWRDRIGPLVYAPDAVVDHAHPLTLRRFWRQHANYGRGARHLHRIMASRGDGRRRREPAGFYAGLLLHPLRARRPAALAQSALMVVSQMAMVAGYAAERRAKR
jgi:GT2 family glycosyltransferase